MNTPKPLVTVAIPTLGRDAVLVDTVKQVLAQNFDRFDLVVVDQSAEHDAATTKFLRDCKDSRWHYYRVTPASLPAARNFAIHHAAADIILFLDDDVIIEPDFIGHHYKAITSDPDTVAVGGRVINQTGTQALTKQPLRFDKYARGSNTFNCDVSQFGESFPGGNMSIKKAAIEAIGGFDTSYVGSAEREESDTAYRLMRAGGKIYFEAAASIVHLAAPMGGSRIFVHWFDSPRFYENDLLFALKTVRLFDLPISLAKRYRDAVRGQPMEAVVRRTGIFAVSLVVATMRCFVPSRVVAVEQG